MIVCECVCLCVCVCVLSVVCGGVWCAVCVVHNLCVVVTYPTLYAKVHRDWGIVGHRSCHLQGTGPPRPPGVCHWQKRVESTKGGGGCPRVRYDPPHIGYSRILTCTCMLTYLVYGDHGRTTGGSSAFGLGDVSCETDVKRLFGEACSFFQVCVYIHA